MASDRPVNSRVAHLGSLGREPPRTTSSPSPRTPDAGSGRPAQIELEFLKLVWRLDHGLRSRSKRLEQELGVTGPQRFTLRMLGEEGPPPSAGELAEHPRAFTPAPSPECSDSASAGGTGGADRRLLETLAPRGPGLDRGAVGASIGGRPAPFSTAAVREALRQTSLADREAAERVLEKIVESLQES